MRAEIVDRSGKPDTEEVSPDPIDHRPGELIGFPSGHESGKLLTAFRTVVGGDLDSLVDRVGDPNETVTLLEMNRPLSIDEDEFRVIENEPLRFGIEMLVVETTRL